LNLYYAENLGSLGSSLKQIHDFPAVSIQLSVKVDLGNGYYTYSTQGFNATGSATGAGAGSAAGTAIAVMAKIGATIAKNFILMDIEKTRKAAKC
jgi:hypothetical protein